MDFLYSSENITVIEVALLLFFNVVVCMFGKYKLALLNNCFFTIYWSVFLNSDLFFDTMSHSENSFLYIAFTFIILTLTILGLTNKNK